MKVPATFVSNFSSEAEPSTRLCLACLVPPLTLSMNERNRLPDYCIDCHLQHVSNVPRSFLANALSNTIASFTLLRRVSADVIWCAPYRVWSLLTCDYAFLLQVCRFVDAVGRGVQPLRLRLASVHIFANSKNRNPRLHYPSLNFFSERLSTSCSP